MPPTDTRRRVWLSTLLALVAAAARAREAAPLTLAAASDLRFALDEVVHSFREARPAARVRVVYGSSGKLGTQVQNGAPFDIFFSADLAYAQQLQAAQQTAGAPRLYALGRLVLWSTDAALGRLTLDEAVRHPAVRRFAIANPEHAPYGQRAMQALRARGLLDAAGPKLVLGDNVSQAAQFVQTGAAQAGIVAYSLVLSPALAGQGAWSLLPQEWHVPLQQAYVVTRHGASSALVHEFLRHLEQPASQAVLRRFGFALPATSAAAGASPAMPGARP